MARKKRTFIIERDPAFTRTIGSVSDDRRDPLSLAVADVNRQIEAEYAKPKPQSPELFPAAEAAERPERPAARAIPSDATEPVPADAIAPVPVAQSEEEAAAPQETHRREGDTAVSAKAARNEAPQPTDEARADTAGAGEAAVPIEVRVTMRVHTDLAERAEKWGRSMGLAGVTVLRQSFARLKPELMAELKTVKAGDIHMDRAESVGPRIQSLLRFSPADYADMQARLDPVGFGIVPSMLNHHARARFSSFLDELMANAGY